MEQISIIFYPAILLPHGGRSLSVSGVYDYTRAR